MSSSNDREPYCILLAPETQTIRLKHEKRLVLQCCILAMIEALALQRSVTPHSTRFLFFDSRRGFVLPAIGACESGATPRISNTSAMGSRPWPLVCSDTQPERVRYLITPDALMHRSVASITSPISKPPTEALASISIPLRTTAPSAHTIRRR